ncbi:integrase [Gossypium australe]|uniref:Integrase n=1 Tax=Gossypium australe TaxID=47621 RepID=A0A5B6WRZ9_9ROSI|nr:integrase [Gossypium australe]
MTQLRKRKWFIKAQQKNFSIDDRGYLRFCNQICISKVINVKDLILRETHESPFAIHTRKKMYRDLREMYWWPGMKKEIVEFVTECLTCQQIWECITMDFIMGLSLSPSKRNVIWVIVDQFMKSAHFLAVRIDWSVPKLVELYI